MLSTISLSRRQLRVTLPVVLLLFLTVYFWAWNISPNAATDSEVVHFQTISNPPVTDSEVVHLQAISISPLNNTTAIDWSQFAYSQYVTTQNRLCHSVMIFEALHRLASKPDRVLMYPESWKEDDILLKHARDAYSVKLIPVPVLISRTPDRLWATSFTKLVAFNLTQYSRVLNLDSDGTLLQASAHWEEGIWLMSLQHMDELFLIPDALIAMPSAYWLNPKDGILSSQLLLIQPSRLEFQRLLKLVQKGFLNEKTPVGGDMDLLNRLYKDTVVVLPHRPYTLLSGEYHNEDHSAYLGSKEDKWDPDKILAETKFVHFSDWPYSKPWIRPTGTVTFPKCERQKCRDQEIWEWFFQDFRQRMKVWSLSIGVSYTDLC